MRANDTLLVALGIIAGPACSVTVGAILIMKDLSTMTPPRGPRVSFQGIPGAFSEMAISLQWPSGAISVPCDSFDEAVAALTRGLVDYAAVPLENAIAGKVFPALAALGTIEDRSEVVATVTVPVQLALMAPPGATMSTVRKALSHHIALAQCGNFFAAHPGLSRQVHFDTAGAARDVALAGLVTTAAVASEAAASRYGLVILARSIQDRPDNWTRFAIVRLRAGIAG